MRIMFRLAIVATAAAICGCTATKPCCGKASCEKSSLPPIKVGVFADEGPSGIGAVEWFRLVEESPEMKLTLLDGKMIREGALDGLDLLVMPGGSSTKEFVSLGTNGVKRMKAFVRNGGGYIGTCAGCCLLMDGPVKRARMMPWNTTGSLSGTLFPSINLNAKGAAALGLKEGPHPMRYHGGPFLWPTTNSIPDAHLEIWGTFEAEANMNGRLSEKKRMYGSGAIVGGRYGKGRVFVTSAHPEYFNGTLYMVKAAFKYVTGRDVTFPVRKRTPRAIAVGFLSGGIYGVDTAQTALDIDAQSDLDLVPIDGAAISQRRLDHLDALVITNDKSAKNKKMNEFIAEFASRGGKVLGLKSGVNMLPPGGIVCGTKGDAVREIRKLFK